MGFVVSLAVNGKLKVNEPISFKTLYPSRSILQATLNADKQIYPNDIKNK